MTCFAPFQGMWEVMRAKIPSLDILADVQVQLDEKIASTEGLKDLIPELIVLDAVSQTG